MSVRDANRIMFDDSLEESKETSSVANGNTITTTRPHSDGEGGVVHFDTQNLLLVDSRLTATCIDIVEESCHVEKDGFQWVQRDLRFLLQNGLHMAAVSFETMLPGECLAETNLVGNLSPKEHTSAVDRHGPMDPSVINILALHGWLDNSYTFRPLMPLLLRQMRKRLPNVRIRVVALDMLGCGRSDHHPLHQYPMFDIVYQAIQVANLLQWRRFGVMGHSYGGAVFTLLPSILPSSRLVFVIMLDVLGFEARSSAPRIMKNAIVQRLRVQYEQRLGNIKRNSFITKEDAAKKLMSRYEHGLTLKGAMHLVERGTRLIKEQDDVERRGRYVFTYDSEGQLVSPFYRFTSEQMELFVKKIQCPALALLPKKGTGWPYANPFFEDRLDLLKKSNKCGLARVIHSEATGHHFHLDYPDIVANDLVTFLSDVIQREREDKLVESSDDKTAIRSRM